MGWEKKSYQKIIVALILIAAILLAFILFINGNRQRIIEQNARYIRDNTEQKAMRVSEVLRTTEYSIHTMALLCDSIHTPDGKVDTAKLRELEDNSTFDYVDFTDKNGIDTNSNGEKSDVSDRDYFKNGMEGITGIDVVRNSRVTDGNLVVFYAPFRSGGEITGVLMGYFHEGSMEELLHSIFFGQKADTFLCDRDGNIITASTDSEMPENIFGFLDGKKVGNDVEGKVKNAFSNLEAIDFTYKYQNLTGNTCMVPLDDIDWMLMQNFPAQVTESMITRANALGIMLETLLISIFAVYVIVLVVINKKQERQFIQTNASLSRIIESVTHLFSRFLLMDFENGTYEYLKTDNVFDPSIPSTGSIEDLLNTYFPQSMSAETLKESMKYLTQSSLKNILTEDMPYFQFERNLVVPSGEIYWENVSVLCTKRSEDGIPLSSLYAIQDMTELKKEELRTHTALKEAFELADHANQAKSQFLSKMSHDIRTPMNAIMGMTAIAAMNLNDPDRVTDCLNKITISSRHLLGLINEILDMSKIESGKLSLSEEEFVLSETIDGLITMITPQLQEKNQHLNVNASQFTHEKVIGDSMRLQQVFLNIMSNAVKFTPEGGTISFAIKEYPSRIPGCGRYEFTFTDTGIGMSPEFMEHIFEPFTRAENARQNRIDGTGLGMSIAYNIIRMMNGDINVESQLGQGTTFTVTAHLKLHAESEEDMEGLSELSVLVVDDEMSACESACAILNSIGMTSEWVLNGDDAVNRLMRAHEEEKDFSAVILDWKMPGKDGVDTAKEIRAKLGDDIPIIILSAYDWSSIEKEARDAGVNAFIAKPLFRSRLIYVLKDIFLHSDERKNTADEIETNTYSQKRVLLVEDNELNMEIACELLSMSGIETEEAFNGKEAVDMVTSKPAGYYDLILMDIQMPVMNGYEATRAIRASEREDLKTIPIIAMSANAFADDIQNSQQAGMNGHIAKPIDIQKLNDTLAQYLSGK